MLQSIGGSRPHPAAAVVHESTQRQPRGRSAGQVAAGGHRHQFLDSGLPGRGGGVLDQVEQLLRQPRKNAPAGVAGDDQRTTQTELPLARRLFG